MKSRLVLLKNNTSQLRGREDGRIVQNVRLLHRAAEDGLQQGVDRLERDKTQLDEVYVLDHTSAACKNRITRTLNNVEGWFNRVKKLMNRLPKDDQPPSVELIAELGKELRSKYLKVFPPVYDTVYSLPIGKNQMGAITEIMRSIDDYVDNMKDTLQSLVD